MLRLLPLPTLLWCRFLLSRYINTFDRFCFRFLFAFWAKPFPLRDGMQRWIQTFDMVRIVTLLVLFLILSFWELRTFSHSNGSRPSSWLHMTHISGDSICSGCRGNPDSLALGRARNKVVKDPAAILKNPVRENIIANHEPDDIYPFKR